MALIEQGESHVVEFKKSTTDITKDVYESVCAFSNRDGGHIFLGVKDNGKILGIQPDHIDQMKKDFITAINNENKMYPPLYLGRLNMNMTESLFFISEFLFLKAFAGVTEEFLTGIMRPTLILQTIQMKCFACMPARTVLIL